MYMIKVNYFVAVCS